MTESDHPYVEWIAREARRPVVMDAGARADARARIMAAVRAEPIPRRRPVARVLAIARQIATPRVFRLSPVASTLVAAGLVGIGVVAGGLLNNRGVRRDGHSLSGVVSKLAQPPVSDTVVKFVVVAPNASKVSLVGDFNNWNDAKTPMVHTPNSVLWTVTLPLTAGRHVYAYLVDGTWQPDPNAPVTDDGFGHMNSVRIVTRGPSL